MFTSMSKTMLGVLLALAVYLLYTTADAMVKDVGYRLGVFEIGLFVTVFSLLPGIFAKPRGETWREAIRLVHPRQTNIIGILRAGAATFATFAFVSIPLAEAYCIIFLIPVFITILSVIVLREEVSATRWVLMFVSFAAVVVVVRPGFRELDWGHLSAIGCALCASSATTLTRMIATTERRFALFLLPGLYTIALNLVALAIFGMVWPGTWDLILLLGAGLLGGFAFIMFIQALTLAPANRIAPMQYSQMVWGLIFGALFFNEVPDLVGFVGVIVLILAGIANVVADGARARIASRWAEYRARRESNPPPPVQGPQA
jgi:drug/metabolite transporter (DMT)-like permease